ncbi:MAG: hypothetical protein N2482_00670 [Patescibacteria group bacterium]|nr:hypothetical protein [Patescibacteria group bacterium]
MKKIIFLFLIFFGIVVFGFFYFLKPISLGVQYTKKDLDSAYRKLAVEYQSLSEEKAKSLGKTLIVSGSHPVEQSFTSQEATALADNRRKNYSYFPFQNVQIRVNPDGTVEGAATVDYQDAFNYLLALGVAKDEIIKAAAKFKIPNANLPVYLKVSGEIENNQSRIVVEKAQISRINVPRNLINQYGPKLNDLVEKVIKDRQPSYNIEKLANINGKIYFKGSSPDKEMAVR